MRVLLVNSDLMGGVEYYRMRKPNHYLAVQHPEFEFDSVASINMEEYDLLDRKTGIRTKVDNKTYLQSFDLVHFCRGIDVWGSTINRDRLTDYGIPFGLDLDDYWYLPSHHVLYNDYLVHKKSESCIQAIKDAHFVTCTTEIIARQIREFNNNVHIIPNAIDHEEDRWLPDYERTDKLRFGFFHGMTHFHDIHSCSQDIVRIFNTKELEGKFQVCLAGFLADETKSVKTRTYTQNGVEYTETITSSPPSLFIGYEKLITDQLKVLNDDPQYQNYLIKSTRENAENYLDKKYFRIWQTHVEEFPYTYHFADISLVPLLHNMFNKCKSELKMIEAGMKGKAVIVQDVNPYKLLATDENSFRVKGKETFYKQIKRCIENPNEVWDKAQQLREDVIARYSLKVTTPIRKQIYEHYAKK